MSGPLPVRFSRNMTIVQEGERLVLVNSVRLNEEGLARLDALGKVSDVIRLAGFHGMDDPFYADRYGAKVWAVKGQRYVAGFKTRSERTYFAPDVEFYHDTGGVSWTRRDKVVDIGPVQVTTDKRESVPLPPVAGGLCLVAGAVLVFAGGKNRG